MNYQVKLKEIDLNEAVRIMDRFTVFYSYEVGKAIFLLDTESLPASIRGNAIYLTPYGWLELDENLM